MSVAHNCVVNLESSTTTVPSSQDDRPNKYIFSAFANFDGERRLETILRKIIPLAEWRTWQASVSFQAPGLPCYASYQKIAERSGRCLRQVQMDFSSLKSRGLCDIYVALVEHMEEDGTVVVRPEVVKDFTGLYRLADTYLRWVQSPAYFPPEREYVDYIKQTPDLYNHLVRFNNYRRILETEKPGRKPSQEPSLEPEDINDEWIAKYSSKIPSNIISQYRKGSNQQDLKDQGANSSSAGGADAKKVGPAGTIRKTNANSKNHNIETVGYGRYEATENENEIKTKTRASNEERPGAAAPASGEGKGGRRGPGKGAQAEKPKLPMYLEGIVLEIAQKFNEVNIPSALTRAAVLYQRALAAGCRDEYSFVEWIEQPQQTTASRLRAGLIKRRNKADDSPAAMPLFFHLLEQRVELAEAQQAAYEEEQRRIEAQQREWEQEAQAPASQDGEDEDQAQQRTQDDQGEATAASDDDFSATPEYVRQVEQIVLDAGDAEYLEVWRTLAIEIYAFCLRYYQDFNETVYLACIESALASVAGEEQRARRFFEVLLQMLELEVVSDDQGWYVAPVGAGGDPGPQGDD